MMKNRLHLILISLVMLALLLPTGLAFAQDDEAVLIIQVTDYPRLVFDGDLVPVAVTIDNIGENQAEFVKLRSSTAEERPVGNTPPGTQQQVIFYLEEYDTGENEVEIYATSDFPARESNRWLLTFEVRPPDESITLRLVDAPQSIYEGIVFTAQLEVQNLWQQDVSGALIMQGDDVLHYVGALTPNQSLTVDLRVEDYAVGHNQLSLVAQHERGAARPLSLEFEVIPAESAVRAYLGSLSPTTYLGEDLQLTLVVASSEEAPVSDLEIKALTAGVQPRAYFLGQEGEEFQPQEEIDPSDLQSLLFPTQPTAQQGEEEPARVVSGQELYFEVSDPNVGTEPLRFEISYRLGKADVRHEFEVELTVLDAPTLTVVQAEPIEAIEGEDVNVTLHVANSLPVELDAVVVLPLNDVNTSPAQFFVGTMAPDDFLPAYFTISGDDVEDGDELHFKATYRVGRDTYETPPLRTVVHIEEEERSNTAAYVITVIVIIVVLVVAFVLIRRRRKRWTQ